MARRRKERELRRSRITVIGEGLTERWYFDHLRTVMGYRYDCKPRFFTHQSYQEMRKLIDWVLQNDGIAVCVCDADITLTNPEEKKHSTFLEKVQWVKDLCTDDKLQLAYNRAEALNKNPEGTSYSNIYNAIKLFQHQSDKI